MKLALTFVALATLTSAVFGDDTKTTAARHFATNVLPLLENKCFGCHGGADKTEGSLDLTSLDATLKGGDTGPGLVAGGANHSAIYLATTRESDDYSPMPPQERNALTEVERTVLAEWINAGAVWPTHDEIQAAMAPVASDRPKSDTFPMTTSGGLSPTWDNREYTAEDVWAYRPIQRPDVPWGVLPFKGPRHPIDAFLTRQLNEANINGFAPPADRQTLLRRATLGLTGLPPSTEAIEQAANDKNWSLDKVIDEQLESVHYGEHLARLWLDVARYADTGGFANDFERPNAWRYRDYVIRSFNNDKPYNRFIIEQVAGDELDENDPENLIAVGYLRTGPWEHTGMSVYSVTRQQFLDDITHSVGVTFLGQGLRCCKCHDHKFDPLPTRDYYRMQANFAPVQFADRPVDYLPEENTADFDARKQLTDRLLAETNERLATFRAKSKAAIAEYLKEHNLKSLKEVPKDKRPDANRYGLTDLEQSIEKVYRKRKDYLERELKRYEPYAFSVYSGKSREVRSNNTYEVLPPPKDRIGNADATHILTGGSIESPSEEVSPGLISAVSGSNDTVGPTAWNTVPKETRGRRLALARWIASDQNPLTARVLVNRIWQRHFGTGLVNTPNNFGKMGAKPTHPELLDYLATWFMDHGWSIKKLDRFIMTSRAYQQSSDRPDMDAVVEKDAANELLSYFPVRRLTAEEIRDSLLAITGELNRDIGGLGVFPKINWEVAQQPRHIMGSVAPAYTPSLTPDERNRRSIYAFRYRTLADPMMEVFNQPVSEISCERRDETTVATQAFALFNSEFTQDRAVALADSIAADTDGLEPRISAVFQKVLGREPTADELGLASQHVKSQTEYHQQNDLPKRQRPTEIVRTMVEELTGEPFEWTEHLIGLEGYVPDKSMADVTPEARALSELCLVLMNSNEFVYVR